LIRALRIGRSGIFSFGKLILKINPFAMRTFRNRSIGNSEDFYPKEVKPIARF